MIVEQFLVEGLGHASHLLIDDRTGFAAVIDPRRDIDLYLQAAQERNVHITHVLETHDHNDFVSGSRELAAATGAHIVAGADAGLHFAYQGLRDGELLELGSLAILAIATPGHTPEHVSYVVSDAETREPSVLFSGGCLLVNASGRTDLLGADRAIPLARRQYQSLYERILRLPDSVTVYPTHGGGSLCSTSASAEHITTLGHERRTNPSLLHSDPEAFIRASLRGLPAIPSYFSRMRPLNQAGPRVLGDIPELQSLTAEQVKDELRQGAIVIDARQPAAFEQGHIKGAFGIGFGDSFATWVGAVVPPDVRLLFVLDAEKDASEVVTALLRIGYEQFAGYLSGGMDAWQAAGLPITKLQPIDVRSLTQRLQADGEQSPVVLDVRTPGEWSAGHIRAALRIEGTLLPAHVGEVPDDRDVAVICGSGYRSTVASSILLQAGFRRLLNVSGGMAAWNEAKLPTTS